MSASIAVLSTGLVTSVGLSAPASCAAMRAGIANPSETRYVDSSGDWIMAHQVTLDQPWRGTAKLVNMAAMAINECLAEISEREWPKIPLVLCVAERDRPGRNDGLDDELFRDIQQHLGVEFAEQSLVIPQGRVSSSTALLHARELVFSGSAPRVLVAAADSLVTWPTLSPYERNERLLTKENSNGFIPGEGGGAVLIGAPGAASQMLCTGLGFANEPAHIESENPLRGDGLAQAISNALAEAGCAIHELDFRINDISGEQYYFKEAALAVARLLRVRKEEFDIWHTADSIGETGALAGIVGIAVADAACRNAYAPGPGILWHAANDTGQRAAAVFQFRAN